MSDEFSFAVHPDHLAIRLSRPARRNSLTKSLIESMRDVLNQNKNIPLVLCAQAPAFCAGFDLDWIATASASAAEYANAIDLLYQLYLAILNHNAPTLAVVEGPAIGGGAGLALCCDSILLSPQARFALPDGELKSLAQIVLPVARRKIPDWSGKNITADQALFHHIADGPIASFPIGSFLKTRKSRPAIDEKQVELYINIAMENRENVARYLTRT